MEIASIVGAVSGCLSLLGIAYLFGVWRGKVDNTLNAFKQCLKDYPPAEMWTMTKTLWDVYVMDALRHRPDLAEHGSFKLKKEGEELIPEHIKPLLDRIPRNPGLREDIATGYLVVKHIGLELVSKMAEEKKVSIQESIAILSCYIDNSSPTA
ncbi:hypothetical protein ES703_95133 [subsurface metagenome]